MAEVRFDGADFDLVLLEEFDSLASKPIQLDGGVNGDCLCEEIDRVFLVLIVGNNVTKDEAEVIDFPIQLPADE